MQKNILMRSEALKINTVSTQCQNRNSKITGKTNILLFLSMYVCVRELQINVEDVNFKNRRRN